MLDIETLGTKPGSVILSIGAVEFDYRSAALGATYEAYINIDKSMEMGFLVDESTMGFWRSRKPEAQQTLFRANDSLQDPLATMTEFREWVRSFGNTNLIRVWGFGSDFDNAMVAAYFAKCNVNLPWRYYNNRCFRTLADIGKQFGIAEPGREGIHHNALDDAKHQARYASRIMADLAVRVPELVAEIKRNEY
jgi:exodeoxyribonuclease VIII